MDKRADSTELRFRLNGAEIAFDAPPGMRLSEALRQVAGARDVKVGCDAGDCGACTVLVEGAPVCSCLTPVAQAAGRNVETAAGLTADDPAGRRLGRGLPRPRRGPVRHLHSRHDRLGHCPYPSDPGPKRSRHRGRAWRRPLPMHRLSQDHPGRRLGSAAPRHRNPDRYRSRRAAPPPRRLAQGDGRRSLRRRPRRARDMGYPRDPVASRPRRLHHRKPRRLPRRPPGDRSRAHRATVRRAMSIPVVLRISTMASSESTFAAVSSSIISRMRWRTASAECASPPSAEAIAEVKK